MLEIIEDFCNIYISNKRNILVKDKKTYIEARKMISKFKENKFNDDFEIVIKIKKYSDGFCDLKGYRDNINFKKVNVVKYVEDLIGIDLKYITEADILRSAIMDDIDNFNNHYNKALLFKVNCIIYAFKDINYFQINNIDYISNYILDNIDIIKNLKQKNNIIMEWLKNEILISNNINKPYNWINDILSTDLNIDIFAQNLIFNEAFKKYKEYDKATLGYPLHFSETNIKINENQFKKIIVGYKEYCFHLDLRLKNKTKEISLFYDANDYIYIMSKISGCFYTEYEVALNKLFEVINTELLDNINKIESYINILLDKFKILFSINVKAKESADFLVRFITKYQEFLSMNYNCNNIEDWFKFYVDEYLKVNNDLNVNDNILFLLDKLGIKDEAKLKLKSDIKDKLDNINIAYEKYLIENYYKILTNNSDKMIYSILGDITKSINQSKVVFIVIDAMRWDMWQIMLEIFEEQGYHQTNSNKAMLSMIPSVTSISRLSLFAGNKYKNIISEKERGLYSFSFSDEENHLKRYFKNKKVAYKIGGKNDFDYLIESDNDLYAFIFSDADEICHGLRDLNKDIIYSVFKYQIDNIINQVEQKFGNDIKIIVATDHGSININNSIGISINTSMKKYCEDFNILYSTHGKFFEFYTNNDLDEGIYEGILDYFKNKKEWIVIDRNEMEQFGLSKNENGHTILFYLIAKYNYYISGIKGSNVHGGLSMNETIIPFAIFKKEKVDYKNLRMDIVDSNLNYLESSNLCLVIYNDNNYDILNLKIEIKNLHVEKEISIINQNSKRNVSLNMFPEVYGNINCRIEINYYKMGENIKNDFEFDLNIKESIKDKITSSVNKSRNLDL